MWTILILFQVIVSVIVGRGADSTTGQIQSGDGIIRIPLMVNEPNDNQHGRIKRAPGSEHTLTMHNIRNLMHNGKIAIGEPEQEFTMYFSTQFAGIWVPSSNCTNNKNIDNSTYDYKKSGSFQRHIGTFDENYYQGKIAGKVAVDHVKVGDVTIEGQAFGAVEDFSFPDHLNSPNVKDHTDGTFGLKYTATPFYPRGKTPLDNLKDQGLIAKRIFCFDMPLRNGINGKLLIGGCNIAPKHTKYLKTANKGEWDLPMKSINAVVNDKHHSVSLCKKKPCIAVIATACTSIFGPKEEMDIINEMIGGRLNKYGKYEVECAKIKQRPVIEINFEGLQIKLTDKHYIARWDETMCLTGFAVMGKHNANATLGQTHTFGIPFIRAVVSVYDMEKDQIGLAQRNNAPTILSRKKVKSLTKTVKKASLN